MALASAKSFGRLTGGFFKGTVVDLPLAVAEGFRAVPRMWGEEVQEYGKVTNWKSGGTVAGKVCDTKHDLSAILIMAVLRRRHV